MERTMECARCGEATTYVVWYKDAWHCEDCPVEDMIEHPTPDVVVITDEIAGRKMLIWAYHNDDGEIESQRTTVTEGLELMKDLGLVGKTESVREIDEDMRLIAQGHHYY